MTLNSIYPDYMVFPSVVAIGAISLWSAQGLKLGNARVKYNIKAPRVDGDPEFEEIEHQYQNTSEALGALIPSTFMFSYYISPKWSLILGGSWIVAKMMSCCSYCCKKEKENNCVKNVHVAMSHISFFTLLSGAAFGVGVSLYNRCKLLH